MVRFAPAVYAANYLNSTGKQDQDLQAEIEEILITGKIGCSNVLVFTLGWFKFLFVHILYICHKHIKKQDIGTKTSQNTGLYGISCYFMSFLRRDSNETRSEHIE